MVQPLLADTMLAVGTRCPTMLDDLRQRLTDPAETPETPEQSAILLGGRSRGVKAHGRVAVVEAGPGRLYGSQRRVAAAYRRESSGRLRGTRSASGGDHAMAGNREIAGRPVTRSSQVACRIESTTRSQSRIWFQLTKFRLTTNHFRTVNNLRLERRHRAQDRTASRWIAAAHLLAPCLSGLSGIC